MLLQATNRFAEAEPLMRRALAIDERNFGLDIPTSRDTSTTWPSYSMSRTGSPTLSQSYRRALAIWVKKRRGAFVRYRGRTDDLKPGAASESAILMTFSMA